MNLCDSTIPATTNDETYEVDTLIVTHEITHVLIMSSGLWNDFVGYTLAQVWDTTDPMGDGNDYIISPRVAEVAQAHYNCPTLVGVPLENSAHWESKLVFSENMISTIFGAEQYVSIFTFALMEDSGWYYVNYEHAKPFKWG